MELNLFVIQKYCSSCRHDLPLTDFGIDVSKRDGHNRICKTCINSTLRMERRQVREIRQRDARGYQEPDPSDLLADDFREFE